MEHTAREHGTPSSFRYLRMVTPNGFGCLDKPFVAQTSDPKAPVTSRVHCPAPIPTASVHMPPTGSTQNSGLSAGGWNMSSTLVLPQATHLTVTWLPCRPAQPMWHSPPCHTSTRPTTTSSAGLHRFHSLKHMATWWWQHQVGEPTTSTNNLAEVELPHLAETRHPGGQSLHRDQSWSVLMLLQHSQHRVEETPINRAFETLRQTAGSTIHSIPASMPAPSADPGPHDLTQVATRADTNPMTQSWNLISGFPTTPSPPRIPDTILGAWFERPPIQFTRQSPPTHIQGMPSLLRADSSFQLNSQLLTEFTSLLENHYPVSMGTWGTIIHGNMTPQVPGHQHFDRLQLIPMASETSTADASLLKFWWHQHLLIARNVAQERFANSSAGPTIISDHLQAFLLTAINLMRLARPVGPPFELRQPEGPALASLAETLLETLQGTMTMEMKMGIATGHIGELVLEGDHNNCRLVFYRTQTWTGPPRQRSMSSTQRSHDDEVEVWEPGPLSCFTLVPYREFTQIHFTLESMVTTQ